MSDQGEDGGGDIPQSDTAGRTMQIDALVDADAVLEDSTAGGEEAPALGEAAFDGPPIVSRAPPPLPKRGPKKSVVIGALAVVMVLSIGAAFAASKLLTATVVPPAVVAPPTPAVHAPVVEAPVAEAPAVEEPRPAHAPITIEAIEITGGSAEEDVDAGPP